MGKRHCSKAYVVGGGLASLATAAYLIRSEAVSGTEVTIIEETACLGGSLDATKHDGQPAYFMRGFRMLEDKVYSALQDLMSFIPCTDEPDKSILDDYREFNEEVKTYALARLVEDGEAINAKPFKMPVSERMKLLTLLALPESKIESLTIDDYFDASFFESNFWCLFSTTFSFLPWHSLEELKRYVRRFMHVAPTVHTQQCIQSTRYNQFESIVLPLKTWLERKGVHFLRGCAVTDVAFTTDGDRKRITELTLRRGGAEHQLAVQRSDLVFLSIGSMTADVAIGAMDKAPDAITPSGDASWRLWNNISRADAGFGRPEVFMDEIDKTKWVSFTTTFNDALFLDLLEKITRRKAGTEGPVTIKDSNWVISFGVPNQPHFKAQPEDVTVFWGYGLYPDKVGNFVKKKMSECTGREILTEVFYHLKLHEHLGPLMRTANCIPCMMPYITSQFMPRKKGDRPVVVPQNAGNFAFIGQYCEIPDDIVFTLEYSVRSAQVAVNTLMNSTVPVTPIHKGQKNPWVVLRTIATVLR